MNYPAAELQGILLINVGADSRQRFKNRHPEMAPTKNVETYVKLMKNPAAETAGYQNQENLSRVLSFLRKQESREKNWIPHQVRNDRNKVTLWQDHRELQVKSDK